MPAKYPHVVKAESYAKDIVSGKILACKWIKAACARHFADKEKSKGRKYKYKFNRSKAEHICVFGEKLSHIKGKLFGELIRLEPWQCFLLGMIFGWVRKSDGRRRFRRADIMIPRKNGKSTIAAIICLYMLVADGEAGAEVYSGATTEKQALEVFKPAQVMVQRSPDFRAHWGVIASARSITQLGTNSAFKTIIGKPGDGASPHCSVHDEYHEHESDEQVDAMRTGMVARQQPLQMIITTAGDNLAGPCFMAFEDGKKILDEITHDEEVFVLIYTVDEEDDWTSEAVLQKANPNFGVSIEADDLISAQLSAIQTPRKQAIFKTKHLNVWVGALNAYFNMQKYRACKDETLREEDFFGKPCIVALDLASKIDLAVMEILFPQDDGSFVRFGKYYMPEETVSSAGRDHYRAWDKEGWLTVTDGEIIDFDVIKDDILALSSLCQVIEIAYDPWQATQLATELTTNGANVVEYRQTVQGMSEPMKKLDAMIRSGQLRHNGDPVAAWCLSNVVARVDAKDNVYPRKARVENKIDVAVAMIMALGRLVSGPEQAPSVYEKRGPRFI